MRKVIFGTVGVTIGFCLSLATLVQAADQTILGKSFVVKDPEPGGDPAKRKITVLGKEPLPDNAIVGDPTAGGASVEVMVSGATPGGQTFPMPAAGWTRIPSNVIKPLIGYKYADKIGAAGPVKSALIKSPGGDQPFVLKAVIVGAFGAIDVLPPNPGTDGGVVFGIAGGDNYCVWFGGPAGGAVVNQPANPPQNKTFKVVSSESTPLVEAGCPGGTAPTTSTIPTTTSTTTTTQPPATTSTTTTASTTSTIPPTTTSTTTTTQPPVTTSTTTGTTTTTTPTAVCGNGVREGAEECDDGNGDNTDACSSTCQTARCGDGFVRQGVEQCDDGNATPADGCTACTTDPPVCGNGRLEAGETCDDGNTQNGDPCPADCRVEPCTPTATRVGTTVRFTRPTGVSVGGVRVYITYPDGRVSIPGTALEATVKARVTGPQTGFTINANDFDYALRVVESAANRTLNPANPLFLVSYDLCTGQTAPAASAFTCTVEQAATPTGDPLPLTGITCSVTVP